MAPVVQVWAAALVLKIAAPKLALNYDSPTIVTVREVMWPMCCSYRFNAFFQKRRWREGGKDENSDVQVRQPDQKIGYGEVPHLETRGYNVIQSESLHLKCLPKKLDSSVQLVNRVWELDLHCSPGSCYSSLTWWCSCGWKRPEWGRQWAEGRAALTLKWYGQNSVTKKVESHRQLSAQCWHLYLEQRTCWCQTSGTPGGNRGERIWWWPERWGIWLIWFLREHQHTHKHQHVGWTPTYLN